MPNFTFLTSIVSTGTRANMGVDNRAYTLVAEGVTIGTTDGSTIIGSGVEQSLVVSGTVWNSTTVNTVRLQGSNSSVLVNTSGAIFSSDLNATAAVNLPDGNGTLVNHGTISGASGIFSINAAAIVNTGTISANGNGFGNVEAGTTAGILLYPLIDDTITNIQNTGTISGSPHHAGHVFEGQSFAIYEYVSGDSLELIARIENGGTLVGNVWLGGGSDRLINTGLIQGYVDTGLQDDAIVNSGTVTGNIMLFDGADSYQGKASGLVFGTVYGGSGDDTLAGSAADDQLAGEDNFDVVNGRAGADTLWGGFGNDTIWGGEGNDLINGDDDFDILRGQEGNDTLNGGSEDDRLYGGAGEDEVNGGLARDLLYGGTGADAFVYATTFDSTPAASDVILDFERGADRIDLSAFAGELVFRGSSGFSGGGTASVRVTASASGASVVQADTDGNGTADLRIIVQNTPLMEAADFLL